MKTLVILPRRFGKTKLCKDIMEKEIKKGKSIFYNYYGNNDFANELKTELFIRTKNKNINISCFKYDEMTNFKFRGYNFKNDRSILIGDDFLESPCLSKIEYLDFIMHNFETIFITSSPSGMDSMMYVNYMKKSGFEVIDYIPYTTEKLLDLFDKGIEIR